MPLIAMLQGMPRKGSRLGTGCARPATEVEYGASWCGRKNPAVRIRSAVAAVCGDRQGKRHRVLWLIGSNKS